ncbi:MAG: methylmalonyl Co-A mutase-associated GTPase MeaB [Candidatus Nealsonbacteria bacterium]|nr:methylmalonyl Co-A mutase-associated GTPase MeaB [Candidatus Nealsonbacteria bacterium]
MNELVNKLRQGNRRALARAMSSVGATGHAESSLEVCLRESTGQVPWWGFTGPPGVGKSTLLDALLVHLREHGRRVGVVAVDPTSTRSDGALLGDRVRMMRHAVDDGVFIRSLATHGHHGGLSDATLHCARLLELAGYDPVLIETVGVGQNEVEIRSVADLCVVVLGPGYGDDIQLVKAGLLEIADVVAVNKCDLPEAQRLVNEVRQEFAAAARDIEVVAIEAKSGNGVPELLQRLFELDRARRTETAEASRGRRRTLGEIRRRTEFSCRQALGRAMTGPEVEQWITKLNRGECSLATVISRLAALALAELQQEADDG